MGFEMEKPCRPRGILFISLRVGKLETDSRIQVDVRTVMELASALPLDGP